MSKVIVGAPGTLTKQELQRQLKAIHESEHRDMIERYYPEFKELEGRYFKMKNSYGSNKWWWMYVKITSILPKDVYEIQNGVSFTFRGWAFQKTIRGEIVINMEYQNYGHTEMQEVTKDEFNRAWNKLMGDIDKLK